MGKVIEEAVETSVDETVNETVNETVEAVEEKIERPYTLRKLKDSDLIPLVKLLRDIGFKEIKESFTKKRTVDKKELEQTGIQMAFDMADMIINNLDTYYNEICEFWAGLSGIRAEEIKEMEFGTLPLMVYDSFAEVKNTAFFKVLSKLL